MIRYFLFALALLPSTSLYTMDKNPEVILNASYLVYEKTTMLGVGVLPSSRYVSFYTYDGEFIESRKHDFSFTAIKKMLDNKAHKPRPVKYKIVHWDGVQIGFGMRKGIPGKFIVFYDKNNNIITRYRYNGSCLITSDDLKKFEDEVDLSIAGLEQDDSLSEATCCSLS